MRKCSIKNFKAFGDKPQVFSDKPITLVYGPNSIGKSSFLHGLLYRENILRGGELDFKKSDFAGDELDLGGFKNFVHKHETDREIEFSYIFNTVYEIACLMQEPDYRIPIREICKFYKNPQKLDEYRKNNLEGWSIQYKKLFTEQYINKCYKELEKNNLGIHKLEIKVCILKNERIPIIQKVEQIEEDVKKTLIDKQDKFIAKIKLYINSELYITFDYDVNNYKHFLDKYALSIGIECINEKSEFVKIIKSKMKYMGDIDRDREKIIIETVKTIKAERGEISKTFYSDITNNYESKHGKIFSNEWDKTPVKDNLIGYITLGEIARNIFEGFVTVYIRRGKRFPIQYLSPLRFYPQREDLILHSFMKKDRGNSSQGIWQEIIADELALKDLNTWLGDGEKLKSNYEIIVKKSYNISEDLVNTDKKISELVSEADEIAELKFIDKTNNTEVTPRDMGLGISQSLPILVACMAKKDTKIFIEQPELHLHPAVQCELADEFIKSKNERNNKFYIETHSEHLLLRIMRRLRYSSESELEKGDPLYITPDDICLIYVDNNGRGTYIEEIRLGKDGRLIDQWPHGFFEEGHKERFL